MDILNRLESRSRSLILSLERLLTNRLCRIVYHVRIPPKNQMIVS